MRTLFLLLLLPLCAGAQQPFVEGSIRYAVSLTPTNSSENPGTHTGTYIITVKGDRVRRELQMAGGFQNVILLEGTAGNAYSLQATPNQKYAIRLNASEVQQRAKNYENYSLKEEEGGEQTIAGNTCKPYTVHYANGKMSAICISTQWIPENPALQEHFPGLKGIPLTFDYRNDDGSVLHFIAEQVESAPVADVLFRVPPDYKVISEDASGSN